MTDDFTSLVRDDVRGSRSYCDNAHHITSHHITSHHITPHCSGYVFCSSTRGSADNYLLLVGALFCIELEPHSSRHCLLRGPRTSCPTLSHTHHTLMSSISQCTEGGLFFN
eukprot:3590634-Amphidinium_carterae.2